MAGKVAAKMVSCWPGHESDFGSVSTYGLMLKEGNSPPHIPIYSVKGYGTLYLFNSPSHLSALLINMAN